MKALTILLSVLFFVTNFIYAQENNSKHKIDKRTPFKKVMYINEHPHININDTWLKITAIANIKIDSFIQSAQNSYPVNWKKEFHKYIHYIMDDFEIVRGDSINVKYINHGLVHSKLFALKRENRDIAVQFHDSIIKTNRVVREHILITPDSLNYLTIRVDGYQHQTEDWLTGAEAINDLDYLEWEINNNYSYAHMQGFDYSVAFDVIRNDLKNGISKRDFALQLKMLMANFGDGHSRVSIRYVLKGMSIKWLPFEIIKHNNKFYAFNSSKKDFLGDNPPEIIKINDTNLAVLYDIAKLLVPKTTSKFIDRNAVENLFLIQLILKMNGQSISDSLTVTFNRGQSQIKKAYKLDKYKLPKLNTDHVLKSSILSNNIGYIAMNKKMANRKSFIDSIHIAMEYLKDTKGLIIDIRRNGGGKRDPLVALLPYFITSTKIVNVARYRINSALDFKPKRGYLSRRFAYPPTIPQTTYSTHTQNKNYTNFINAIHNFQKDFKPTYNVSDSLFSSFHYMAVHPNSDDKRYYYSKSVIVLIDEGCFSATDIFAAGICTGNNVKLLGNTTGGGSGYSTTKHLPYSNIGVKLSRMVSYQPNGNLYDGHGVLPDISADYTLNDRLGKSDSMLEKALNILMNQK